MEHYVTAQQYLNMERSAESKSEYVHGEIVAMAGATEAHNLVVTNVLRELSTQLKGRPCRTYPSDMKVEVGLDSLFCYPDVSVVCGEPQFHDKHHDMVRNPCLIVEVASRSTEAYDRGAKFAQYRRLASLTDYILISTVEMRIEHYTRQHDDRWLLSDVPGGQQSVKIASLNCELEMSEVYDRVDLPVSVQLEATLSSDRDDTAP